MLSQMKHLIDKTFNWHKIIRAIRNILGANICLFFMGGDQTIFPRLDLNNTYLTSKNQGGEESSR
jgi:hypothetical protein